MARSTQFIGLNALAQTFIQENHLTPVKHSKNHTTGMFDEEIPLSEWTDTDGNAYTEVVQDEPWSSGPMIFTALHKAGTDPHEFICPWTQDPNIENGWEYNFKTGQYWV